MEKEILDCEEIMPSAPLTNGKEEESESYPNKKYRFGRKVIRIPLSTSSLNEKNIMEYLPKILNLHTQNVADYEHLSNVYKGKTNILNKKRPFKDDEKNTVVSENHIFSMVEFKKGFSFQNDIKYSCSEDVQCTDDLTFIGKYMKDQGKATKNIELSEDVYVAGSGLRLVLPKHSSLIHDINKDSPFELFNLNYESAFVVYSSNFTKEKLFGGVITTIDSPNKNDVTFELLIYDRFYSYRFTYSKNTPTFHDIHFISKKRHYIGYVPIVEYYMNKSRLGIVEVTESLLDGVNDISSYAVDNVADYVNSILAIYNMEIDKDTKKNVDDTRALSLITTDPSRPADAKYLVNALNQGDVATKYETLIKVAYSICGVPQATTQSTSGGDTGEARELGGGWEFAHIIAGQQEEVLKAGEKEMLEITINICKKTPKCPVQELSVSDIEINFNRMKNNNILVKSQSLQNLIAMNMPKEIALDIVGVTSNPHEVALKWNEELKEKELKAEQQLKKKEAENVVGTEKETEDVKNNKEINTNQEVKTETNK